MKFAVKVGSVTIAQRGAKALRKKGLKPTISRIENPQPNDGCGYVIVVKAENQSMLLTILKDAGINALGVEKI